MLNIYKFTVESSLNCDKMLYDSTLPFLDVHKSNSGANHVYIIVLSHWLLLIITPALFKPFKFQLLSRQTWFQKLFTTPLEILLNVNLVCFSFFICESTINVYLINGMYPKIQFQNIVQCPFNWYDITWATALRWRTFIYLFIYLFIYPLCFTVPSFA